MSGHDSKCHCGHCAVIRAIRGETEPTPVGRLTRGDFEALLWDYLHKSLPTHYAVLLSQCGITPDQWEAFTEGERAEFRAALSLIRSETARRVWDVNYR